MDLSVQSFFNIHNEEGVLDDKYTDEDMILRGSQKPQANFLSGRIFNQMLGAGVFALSTVFFFREIVPVLSRKKAPLPLNPSFLRQFWRTHAVALSILFQGISSLFFFYTLNKKYWSDPKFVQEQRVEFLQSIGNFRELFDDCEHLNNLLNYGSVTPQEMRNQLEKTLSFSSHLDFVAWILKIDSEDLAAYKYQGLIDEHLVTQFSIGRSPLNFLDLSSILDSNYWLLFFNKLIETKILPLDSFQKKFEQELEQVSHYKELTQKITWKKIKLLLSHGFVKASSFQSIMKKTDLNDIKLLLQEEELREILKLHIFPSHQLSWILQKEVQSAKDLWEVIRNIPLEILQVFYKHQLFNPTLFHQKFLALSSTSMRQLLKFLKTEELKLLIEEKIIPYSELKQKFTLDCQRITSIAHLIRLYGLKKVIFFIDHHILDTELIKQLPVGEGLSNYELLKILHLPPSQALHTLDEIKKYGLIDFEEAKKQLSLLLSLYPSTAKLFQDFPLSFLKTLVKKGWVEVKKIAPQLKKTLLEEGLINFYLLFAWEQEDFLLFLGEESPHLLPYSLLLSVSAYPDFFSFIQDYSWEELKSLIERYQLPYNTLHPFLSKSFKGMKLHRVFEKIPPSIIEEMLDKNFMSKNIINDLWKQYSDHCQFFDLFKDYSDHELELLINAGLLHPFEAQKIFHTRIHFLPFAEIENLLSKDFLLLEFCRQKEKYLKELGIYEDVHAIEKLVESQENMAQKEKLWKEWKASEGSIFSKFSIS